MTDQLKSCPFCGGDRIGSFYIRDGRRIGCRDCGGGLHAFNPDAEAKAREKWNTRAKEEDHA